MYEFYGVIQNGKPCFTQNQRLIRQDFFNKLKDGTQFFERLGIIPHPKTDAQRKAFFGLVVSTAIEHFNDKGIDTTRFLIEIARFLLENKSTGNPVRTDFLKGMLYTLCPVFDANGRRKTIASMSIDEMRQFYEDTCNVLASIFNIYIPDCDKNWRKKKDPFDKGVKRE